MSPPLHDNLPARLGAHFTSRWDRSYIAAKLRSDPLYEGVFATLEGSHLPLLDIGCGLGILAFFLRSRGFSAPIVGLDNDLRKIREASRVAAGFDSGLTFRHHDARQGLPAHSGNVTILDILQFFEPAERRALLRSAAGKLAPGASLVIRSALRDHSWRFRITVAGDKLARATRWMRSGPVHYPTRREIEDVLAPFGEVSISPLWGRTPFSNYLIVLRCEAHDSL